MRGVEVLAGLSLMASYLAVCGQELALDRPTCYPCPALFGAVHIMVIEPKRWFGPVECSRGTKPPKQPTLRRLLKRLCPRIGLVIKLFEFKNSRSSVRRHTDC